MTSKAKWELEELFDEKITNISDLMSNFLTDIKKMVDKLSVYKLKLKANQTAFKLYDAKGNSIQKDAIYTGLGLYIIFSCSHVVYVGEASNLQRRQFQDPGNTANSTKRFNANIFHADLAKVKKFEELSRLPVDPFIEFEFKSVIMNLSYIVMYFGSFIEAEFLSMR